MVDFSLVRRIHAVETQFAELRAAHEKLAQMTQEHQNRTTGSLGDLAAEQGRHRQIMDEVARTVLGAPSSPARTGPGQGLITVPVPLAGRTVYARVDPTAEPVPARRWLEVMAEGLQQCAGLAPTLSACQSSTSPWPPIPLR